AGEFDFRKCSRPLKPRWHHRSRQPNHSAHKQQNPLPGRRPYRFLRIRRNALPGGTEPHYGVESQGCPDAQSHATRAPLLPATACIRPQKAQKSQKAQKAGFVLFVSFVPLVASFWKVASIETAFKLDRR